MDGNWFDAISRTVFIATSRRRALGRLLGGTLALLGLASPDNALAATGNCKPRCGKCETCK